MKTAARQLALAAFAVALTTAEAAAQQSPSTPRHGTKHRAAKSDGPSGFSGSQSTWGKTKDMTRREWNAAKRKWPNEKVKWQDRNRQSDGEKLTAPKSWSYVARCTAKS